MSDALWAHRGARSASAVTCVVVTLGLPDIVASVTRAGASAQLGGELLICIADAFQSGVKAQRAGKEPGFGGRGKTISIGVDKYNFVQTLGTATLAASLGPDGLLCVENAHCACAYVGIFVSFVLVHSAIQASLHG